MYVSTDQVRRGRNSPQVLFIQKPLLVADHRETLFVLLQRCDQLSVLLVLVFELLRCNRSIIHELIDLIDTFTNN